MLRAMIGTAPLAELVADADLAYHRLPPGTWHASACAVLGGLLVMDGEHDRARTVLAEGAAEARISKAPTVEGICLAHLALVHDTAGDRDQTTTLTHAAREVLRVHRVEDVTTTALVLAMSALGDTRDGKLESARADWLMSRNHLAGYGSVAPWVNVLTRLVLARTGLLLGDRVTARILLEEAERHLRRQSEATWPKAQLAELYRTVQTAREVLPYGPSSLTTAELRVLQYLPTNLTFREIAQRLFVSKNTAKTHAVAIYRKLGTSSRGHAVELAQRAGLLSESGWQVTLV